MRREWMTAAAVAGIALTSLCLAACDGGSIGQVGGEDGGVGEADAAARHDGPSGIPLGLDAGAVTQTPQLTPNSVTVNVGINRAIVPDYPGDACGSISRILVIDAQGPNGALQHQELDCQATGANGWTYFDMPAGHYSATMQLFDMDTTGKRVAATPARTASGDLHAGQGALIWVDFTYRDFTASYQGNLKWQTMWVSDDAAHGCADANPPVVSQLVTVIDDKLQVVHARTVSPGGGSLATDGSAVSPCVNYGTTDAEVLPFLTWGIYTINLQGIAANGKAAYCVRRALFVSKGESIIYHLLASEGGC